MNLPGWKWVLALLVSVTINIFAIIEIVELKVINEQKCKIMQRDARIDQLTDSLETNKLLLDSYMIQRTLVTTDLLSVAERARKTRIVYQNRALPEVSCAPTPDRVSAVNEILATDFTP